MLDLFTDGRRSAEDLLGGRVRVSIGGAEYELRVRSIRANREWKAKLDAQTSRLISELEEGGDDIPALLGALSNQVEPLLDMLLAYDVDGVLPSREAILDLEPDASMDVVNACREVWRAASPLVVASLAQMTTLAAIQPIDSSKPSSSRRPRTGGSRRRSRTS